MPPRDPFIELSKPSGCYSEEGRQLLAGRSSVHNLQVIIGEFLAIWFTLEGDVHHTDLLEDGPLDVTSDDWFEQWTRAVGFVPGPIRVRPFSVPSEGVGIRLLPSSDLQILCDPYREGDHRAERLEATREWLETGAFVLYWGSSELLVAPPEGRLTPPCSVAFFDAREIVKDGKLFTLFSEDIELNRVEWCTGKDANNQQLILGRYGDHEVLLLTFSADGQLLSSEARRVTQVSRLHYSPEELDNLFEKAIRAWKEQLGWVPSPIAIQAFRLKDHHVYITTLPDWALRYHFDPYGYAAREERDRVQQRLAQWNEEGSFVFYWLGEYAVRSHGELILQEEEPKGARSRIESTRPSQALQADISENQASACSAWAVGQRSPGRSAPGAAADGGGPGSGSQAGGGSARGRARWA